MNIIPLSVGPLRANAYILYLPERNDALVIDPGAEPETIRKALQGRTLTGIVLTHGHADHIGAVSALRGENTPVYIHASDAEMLVNPNLSLASSIDPHSICQKADILLTDGEITIAGIPLSVIPTPGHTPGSICLAHEMTLFTGDTLFRQGYGRTDFPGGDADQLFESLQMLFTLDPEIVVYPGHDASTTIGAEKRLYNL